MELKIILLPLHLGLLAAFHQNAEVNILTERFPTIYLLLGLTITSLGFRDRSCFYTFKYALVARSSQHSHFGQMGNTNLICA